MTRPVVGIIGNSALLNDEYPVHTAGELNSRAISHVAGAIPLIVPSDPKLLSVSELLETCDGFLLTGARANVHPGAFGSQASLAHGTFDTARDAITLPLIRACVERGQPFFAVCRGFQELNVAMGGTLHPEIREIPGRMNHRMPPDGTLEEKFEHRHDVILQEGGPFHRMLGAVRVRTNTLHGQGIAAPGDRIVIDGRAEDGTPEAIYVDGAAGFAMGVQWHPEWNAENDRVSRVLFEAFGTSLRAWAAGEGSNELLSA